jgi:hypothetical protein
MQSGLLIPANFIHLGAKPIRHASQLPATFPSSFKLKEGLRPPSDKEEGAGLIAVEEIHYDAVHTMGCTLQLAAVYTGHCKRQTGLAAGIDAGDLVSK